MGGAWYVGRIRWRELWWQLLILGIVAGIVGGAVLGALAGARRSLSAYDRLVHVSRSPHEVLSVLDHASEVLHWAKASPLVDHVGLGTGMIGRRAPSENWYSLDAPSKAGIFGAGAAIERGRLPSASRADEVFITLRTAMNTGLDVGDTVSFRAYDRTQVAASISNPWTVPAGERVRVRVVGIARDPTDAQLSQSITLLFGSPAFARAHARTMTFTPIFVWLKGGPAAEVRFERSLARLVGSSPTSVLGVTSSRAGSLAADESARPVAIGLLIFAVVAGLGGLVTILQGLRRGLASREGVDGFVLSALGATRAERTAAQVTAGLPYIGVATVVAFAMCYASSLLFPIGATRALEPSPGLRADAFVLTVGVVAWLLILLVATVIVAWINASASPQGRTEARRRRGAVTTGAAALPAVIGLRFAVGQGGSRNTRRRVAFAGVIVAVAGVTGSLVFTRSLDTFTSAPTRFGLGFNLSLELPSDRAQAVLAHLMADKDLAAVAESQNGSITLDGRTVAAYSLVQRKHVIATTLRSGALPQQDDEIALGPKLLDTLHKRIGEDVQVDTNSGRRKLRIIGTVLSPASEANAFNAEAVLTTRMLDEATSYPSVNALVRVRPGEPVDVVTTRLHAQYPYGVTDESPAHAPGQVRNLEQVARLPLALVLFFALLGAVAVVQAVFLTTTERRRDFAVLRGLGFTRGQIGGVLRVAAASVAALALLVGIPAGVLAGTVGWKAVANALYVAPVVALPTTALAATTVGLFCFAIMVGMIAAHITLRNPPGPALRAE
jgi:ABC-type lipoprotein release transport system permease subunit